MIGTILSLVNLLTYHKDKTQPLKSPKLTPLISQLGFQKSYHFKNILKLSLFGLLALITLSIELGQSVALAGSPPYPPSTVITSINWDHPSSIIQLANGSDNWPITWGDDGDLYTSYGDGWGFRREAPQKLSLGFAKVVGDPPNHDGINIWSPTGEQYGNGNSGKKGSGMLMVDDVLYMWVRNADNNGKECQLAWSTDQSVTWQWNTWNFSEFGYCAFLNFGQNYAGARDNYVYMYTPNTNSSKEETDEVILTRVPKDQILDRQSYEFFQNIDTNGNPIWTADINQRGAAFVFPGGSNRLDVSYNAAIGRYMMTMRSRARNGGLNQFSIYDAPEPWGPWSTVYYTETYFGNTMNQTNGGWGESQHIPTKWISPDGARIHLVCSCQDTFSVLGADLVVNLNDTTPPVVSVTAPQDGATVSGNVSITADASDNGAVASVEFEVDGTPIGTDTTDPYEITWDASGTPDGQYPLTAIAQDSQGNQASDTITINLVNGPPVNQAPLVDVGADQVITLPDDTAVLNAVVSDDGLPSGSLTQTWSMQSGPGTVNFSDPNAVSTDATFSVGGAYTLRLTADDSELSAFDELDVTVNPQAILTSITISPNPATVFVNGTIQFTASGTDQFGNPMSVNPVWSATSGNIDNTGLLTAGPNPESITVTASEGGISGQADLTVINPPTSLPKQSYLDFDGNDDRLEVPHDSSLEFNNTITIEAWINPRSISSTNSQDRAVSKGSDLELTISTGDSGCASGTNGDVQWRAKINGSNKRICGGSLTPGNWYHVAGTYNGSEFTLYIDGVEAAAMSRSGLLSSPSGELQIGNKPGSSRYFDGAIEDVRIWNVARTAQEILDNKDVELSGTETGLMAYYSFNEGSGQVASDATTNSNDATLGSTSGSDTNDPTWVGSPPPTNNAPMVDAGSDQTIMLPTNSVNLDGVVSDDGQPSGTLITIWSGPSEVTFGDVNSVNTTATFSATGSFVLTLTADDTELTSFDTVTIQVDDPPVLDSITVTPDSVSIFTGGSQTFTASGLDQFGNPYPVNPIWTATGGTVTPNGTDTAIYDAGSTPGTFSVTAMEGPISGDATVTLTASNTSPIADADGPYSGDEGIAIPLNGTGSSDAEYNIVAYEWDLDDDGQFDDASGETTSFPVSPIGIYNISLRVTDDGGLTDTDSTTVTINNVAPLADAGGTYTGDEGGTIALDGSGSSDPGNDLVSYEWDLDDDGQFDDANGLTVSFPASPAGVYDIALRVTDGGGLSDVDQTTVTLNNLAPTADAGGTYSGDEGTSIVLDGSDSSDPGNNIISYEWDLDNDGQFDDANGEMASFPASTEGIYNIGLKVTDLGGLSDISSTIVTVNNVAPTSHLGGPYFGNEGSSILLDGSGSSDPGNNIVSYEWDLNDDGQFDDASGQTTSFALPAGGTYNIALRVTDGGGLSDIGNTTVNVNNVAPTADSGGPYSGDEGNSIFLDGSGSYDPGNDIISYDWDLDDDGQFDDASGVSVSFPPSPQGTYNISLKVTDGGGLSHVDGTTVTVNATVSSITESWTGPDGSSWPTKWSFDNANQAINIDISGNRGRVGKASSAPGLGVVTAYVNSAESEDVDATVTFNITSNAMIFGLMSRRADGNSDTYYYTKVESSKDKLSIHKMVDGVDAKLGQVIIPNVSSGTDFKMRFVTQTNGGSTVLQAKVWYAAESEPAAFQLQLNDGDPNLQGVSGRFGLRYEMFRNRTTRTDDYTAILASSGN